MALAARTPAVAAAYAVVALVMTWPVPAHLSVAIAGDLGDPLFNSWVLAWTTGQVLRALGGDVSAITNFWHANIFHPEPFTLAYSEHLFAQTLQVLPLQALTGNVLLSYNVLFISTFALSGLAVYLLVRELTDRPLAAFLAGLAFAYSPYRMGQLSHLQVLSSYWMPLALVGFRRYFVRVSEQVPPRAAYRALAGGAAALAMQNLSNGYYMLFFAPFVVAYCLYEMVQRRLVRRRRVWLHLTLAAAGVALVTWPFAHAYLQLREVSQLGVRTLDELIDFSADTHSFVTPPDTTRWLKSWMEGYPRPEGTGFPGFTVLTFAFVGVAVGLRRLWADLRAASLPEWQIAALSVAGLILLVSSTLLSWFFVNGSLTVTMGSRVVVYQRVTPILVAALTSLVAVAILVSIGRRGLARPSDTAFGFFAMATLAAALLALGPYIYAIGHPISVGPYLLLFEYVPGYDGLRVPARFLMLVTLFLAVLAGLGASRVLARHGTFAALVVCLGVFGILFEGWAAPMLVNGAGDPDRGLVKPPPPAIGRAIAPIYDFVRTSPTRIVLLELPFGDQAYDTMAVFYAGQHRKPIVNGYSGMFPRGYRRNASALRDVTSHPDRARRALARIAATHVLVHEGAWRFDEGREVSEWLMGLGAEPVGPSGSDRLFALPPLSE